MHRHLTLLLLSFTTSLPAQFPGLDAPVPAEEKKTDAPVPKDPKDMIKKIEGTRFQLGVMEFDQKTRELRIPCKLNLREGLLEYVLVHESGKAHESLLTTTARPTEVNIALLLLDWKVSEAFWDYTEPERGGVLVKGAKNPPASQLEVHATWKDKDGKEQTAPLESWLHNIEKRAKITREPWIYTGSRVMPDGKFLAEETGSILALYADPASIINNPRAGNDMDDVWVADPEVPGKDTPVTLIFKPAAPAKEAPKPAAEKAPPKKRSTR
jgi:hypothetical protein